MTAQPAREPLAVSVEDACYLLSLSRAYLYLLIERGELVTVKVGRKRLVQMRSIHEFLERHAAAS